MVAQMENDNIICHTGPLAIPCLIFAPFLSSERTSIFAYLDSNGSRLVFYTKTKPNNSVISNSFITHHHEYRFDQSIKQIMTHSYHLH